jgi:squalene-hopene cyclase-like protein
MALDDNGGAVERVTGEYAAGADGRRLIDGKQEPVWAWRGSALRDLPLDIVVSFYKRQPLLVTAVAIEMPPPDSAGALNGNAPKDVELWTSMRDADAEFEKVASAALVPGVSPQTIAFPSIEARYVKIRVRSVQGPLWALSRVEIGDIRVLEAQRASYKSVLDRNPDLPEWKNSPRRAAQRGIDWLQPAVIQWQKDHACFGCHIQAQAVMGLAIAKKNDYTVSDQVLHELNEFTEQQQKADGTYVREDTGEASTLFAAMGLAYWDELNGIGSNPKLTKSADWLAARQTPAGELSYRDWQSCGVRAVEQGSMMKTANTLVAFERAFVETHHARYREAADRARTWITAAEPVTTQDKVFKILALARFGGSNARPIVQRIVEQLMLEQQPAGGWRECNEPSTKDPNPFSTGQVLYAFKQAGVSIASSPFLKGVKYLLDTQNADGSWSADSRALHTMGAPHAPSMWAIIGLAGSFGHIKTGGLQVARDLAPERAATRRNLEIILDLSGSMKLPLGASTRIAVARQVLRDVLEKIPDDFNVGLRVYANRFSSRQKETCTDTTLVSKIAKLDRRRILSIVDALEPRGETPLVYSILQAPADLQAVGGGSLIVITDGEETCGGDPVAAARRLKDAGLPIALNIVGFTLTGKKVEQDLTELAEATGGHYYAARDGEALARALTKAALTRIPYSVFDEKGTKVASGFAGPLAEALEPGAYRVVVEVPDQELTERVTVTAGVDVILKVAQRGGRFELQR